MAGKNTGVSTKSKGAIKFSGLPSPLDKTEPWSCQHNSIQLFFNEHLSPPFLFRYF